MQLSLIQVIRIINLNSPIKLKLINTFFALSIASCWISIQHIHKVLHWSFYPKLYEIQGDTEEKLTEVALSLPSLFPAIHPYLSRNSSKDLQFTSVISPFSSLPSPLLVSSSHVSDESYIGNSLQQDNNFLDVKKVLFIDYNANENPTSSSTIPQTIENKPLEIEMKDSYAALLPPNHIVNISNITELSPYFSPLSPLPPLAPISLEKEGSLSRTHEENIPLLHNLLLIDQRTKAYPPSIEKPQEAKREAAFTEDAKMEVVQRDEVKENTAFLKETEVDVIKIHEFQGEIVKASEIKAEVVEREVDKEETVLITETMVKAAKLDELTEETTLAKEIVVTIDKLVDLDPITPSPAPQFNRNDLKPWNTYKLTSNNRLLLEWLMKLAPGAKTEVDHLEIPFRKALIETLLSPKYQDFVNLGWEEDDDLDMKKLRYAFFEDYMNTVDWAATPYKRLYRKGVRDIHFAKDKPFLYGYNFPLKLGIKVYKEEDFIEHLGS